MTTDATLLHAAVEFSSGFLFVVTAAVIVAGLLVVAFSFRTSQKHQAEAPATVVAARHRLTCRSFQRRRVSERPTIKIVTATVARAACGTVSACRIDLVRVPYTTIMWTQ